MTSLMMAVERLRERGELPGSGPVSLTDLLRQVRPEPAGSLRALLSAVLTERALRRPFAVILCRFKDDPPDAGREGPIESFYREAFTPGSGGMVEYWREASLGMVDVSGSQVFGWVQVDLDRLAAGGLSRGALVDAGVDGARRAGHDPAAGFFRPIAVYSRAWSADDPRRPAGSPNWTANDPLKPWWGQWIDWGADGSGRISLAPDGHNGNATGHEMGHSLGLGHDVGPSLETGTDYSDPCCVMSQQNPFTHPRWQRAFGPALCLPHLDQQGWAYVRRVYRDEQGDWARQPDGLRLPLAPLTTPVARANLGIVLSLRPAHDWAYYLEFVTPTGWNQGLGKPYLFIRRLVDIPSAGRRPAYLALVEVPTDPGVPASVLEPSGNTWFEVQLTDLPGPVISVTAKKL